MKLLDLNKKERKCADLAGLIDLVDAAGVP